MTFVENTVSNLLKVTRAKFLGSDSISKFGSFKKAFWTITSLLNFTVDSEDLFCFYKWKKWFLWAMSVVQVAENHGDRWLSLELIFKKREICINSNLDSFTKSNSSSRRSESKDILPWNLSNDHEDCSNQHNNSHKQCDEKGVCLF